MRAARDHFSALLLCLLVVGCTMSPHGTTGGLAQANALVGGFGQALGVRGATLDRTLDRSFGELGFHYDPRRDILTGRVFIAKADIKSDTQEAVENYRKVARALNDPAIGGRFEQGGGHFVLDEDKEMYFLVKEFPVSTTSPRQLRHAMEDLANLGATWTMKWFYRVATIAHGHEPPPKAMVTRANDG